MEQIISQRNDPIFIIVRSGRVHVLFAACKCLGEEGWSRDGVSQVSPPSSPGDQWWAPGLPNLSPRPQSEEKRERIVNTSTPLNSLKSIPLLAVIKNNLRQNVLFWGGRGGKHCTVIKEKKINNLNLLAAVQTVVMNQHNIVMSCFEGIAPITQARLWLQRNTKKCSTKDCNSPSLPKLTLSWQLVSLHKNLKQRLLLNEGFKLSTAENICLVFLLHHHHR